MTTNDKDMPEAAIHSLKNHQSQLDMDGIEVGVSRQALDEILNWIETRTPRTDTQREEARKVWRKFYQEYNPHDPIDQALYDVWAVINDTLQSPAPDECQTCSGDDDVCAEVPSLRHCEKANREDAPVVDVEELKKIMKDPSLMEEARAGNTFIRSQLFGWNACIDHLISQGIIKAEGEE